MDSGTGNLRREDRNIDGNGEGLGVETGYEFSSFEFLESGALDWDAFTSSLFDDEASVCNRAVKSHPTNRANAKHAFPGNVRKSNEIVPVDNEFDAFDYPSDGKGIFQHSCELPVIHDDQIGFALANLHPKDDA
eukprot:IDg3246t1